MLDTESLLARVRTAIDAGGVPAPDVRAALLALDDPAAARKAGRLLARLTTDGGELRPVRIAILATYTIGSFEPLLRASLVGAGALPTIVAGEYGSFGMTLAAGQLAGHGGHGDGGHGDGDHRDGGDPDVVVLLMDETYFLPRDWDAVQLDALGDYVTARAEELRRLVGASLAGTSATVVLHTIPLPAEMRDAVISWKGRSRLSRIWNQLNAVILDLADEHRQVVVVDLVNVLADAPAVVRDDRLHRYADMPYTDGALFVLAREVRRVAQARLGLSRKVLALDLDNTLWGGVVGEVGAHGVTLGGLYPGNCYQLLQRAAARLRSQGVVLVLVSKNDADLVEEALTKHPDMILRPEAFSVSAVNWSAKAGNLRQAAETLGLSTQSFVFMDDSPFEREHVGTELPEIAVIAADGDPAHLVRSLLRHGWFDVMELTETDRARPELYRSRALREDFSSDFASSEDYLHALGIELVVEKVDDYAVGRVAQLAARTNQFNLTGIRFDEATTATMAADPAHLVASFAVNDRFGSEGIIGAVWVDCGPQTWRVLNLVLSCRVLGRGVELAIAGWIAGQARAAGATVLEGRFVKSTKNHVASGFWEKAGLERVGAGVEHAGIGVERIDDDEVFALELDRSADLAPSWIRIQEGNHVSR